MLTLDAPIYVGFSGPAGSGKTSTANKIAGPGGVRSLGSPILFDHYFLAKPLYDIVSTKRMIEGEDAKSRKLYEIHDTVSEIIGRSVEYDDLVELVYDIYAMDAGLDGESKPRSFMQQVGDMLRGAYEDCFVDTVIRRSALQWADTVNAVLDSDEPLPTPYNFILISDTRRLNEFNKLRAQQNCILVRLEASRETLNQRLIERDGHGMTEEQWNHPTETEANEVPKDWFDLVLDTNELSLNEQARAVRDFLIDMVGYAVVDGKYTMTAGV